MADKVTISFAFDDKVTPRLDVIASRIKEIDKALQKARNFKVNTRSVSTSLDRVNGRLTRISKNLDEIKGKKLFIDTRNTNQKLTGVNTRLKNISTKLGNALGTVKINTGSAQRSLNTMLTKVETIQNALGKTQLNPSKVAAPKDGRAAGRDAFAKLRGAFSRTRDPILQVNKALVQFRKEFRAAAKITKGFPGLRTAIKDFTRFEDAIKKIQKANFKNASKSFNSFAQKVKAATKPLTEFVAAIKTASKVAKQLEESLKKSIQILSRISKALAIAAKANQNFGKMEKRTSRVAKGFAAIGRRVPLLNKFFGGPKLPLFIDRLRKLRFALVDVRNILNALGVGAFFNQIKQGIKDAANFEILNAQISTLIQGLGPGGGGTRITGGLGERFDFDPIDLADSERQLEGALTALNRLVRDKAVEAGQDIEKTFKAAYDSISSGIPIDDLDRFLTQASKLAIGGVSDISKATKLLLSVFQTTGRNIDQLEDQTDSLFTLVRLGRTTIDELSGSLGRVLPIAQAAGVSVDEVGGAISALSAGGLTTAEAVTALRQVLNKIINPSVASAELARQLGIQLDTAAIRSKGLKGVLEEIALATKSNTDVIGNLFPRVRALVGVLSLLRGEGTQTLDDFFDPFEDKAGATETAVDRIKDTLVQTVNELKTAFQSLRAELFEFVLPGLQRFAEVARDSIKGFFQPFRDGLDTFRGVEANVNKLVDAGGLTRAQGDTVIGAFDEARQNQVVDLFNTLLARFLRIGREIVEFAFDNIVDAVETAALIVSKPGGEIQQFFLDVFNEIIDQMENLGNFLIDAFMVGLDVFLSGLDALLRKVEIFGIRILKGEKPREPITEGAARTQLSNLVQRGTRNRDAQFDLQKLASRIELGIKEGLISPESAVAKALSRILELFGGKINRGGPFFQNVAEGDSLGKAFEDLSVLVRKSREELQDELDVKRKAREVEAEQEIKDRGEAKRLRAEEFEESLKEILKIQFPKLDFVKAILESDLPQEAKALALGALGEFKEAIVESAENEVIKIPKATSEKASDAVAAAAIDEFGTIFSNTRKIINSELAKLASGQTQNLSLIQGVSAVPGSIVGAQTALAGLAEGPGQQNLQERFKVALSTIETELERLARTGGKSSAALNAATSELRSFTAESKQLSTFIEEVGTLRRAEAAGAKGLAAQLKLEVQQKLELIKVRQKGSEALLKEVEALQAFEKQLLKLNQVQAEGAAILSTLLAQEQIARIDAGAKGDVNLARGLTEQANLRQQDLIFQQIDIEERRQQFLSGADLAESQQKVAELSLQLAELNAQFDALKGNEADFNRRITDFILELPTRAEIAFETVTGFAERTATFLSETIANGIKILVQDGFGSFKDAVKDLDETLGRFFGNLLIDLGTAIVKAVLLRTIMSAIGGPLGGLFFNTGGPVPRMGFNSGGTVGGPPSANRDVVPAMLTPGEFVIRREAAQSVGTRFLMGLNSLGGPSSRFARSSASPRIGGVRGFNMGGPVAAGAGSAGGAQPTYLLSNEQNAQSFLQGGENAFISFLRENRNKF
jgi:TP901 family phage tail tape measure protein